MRSITRSLVFGLTILFGANAMAQFPNVLQINGTVPSCYPGQQVILATTGATLPSYFMEVPVDASTCTFTVTLDFATELATFALTTYCAGVITQAGSVQLNATDTTVALVSVICDLTRIDCEGVYNGPMMPGVPCNDGNPLTQNDIVQYSNCMCMGAEAGECIGSWNWDQVMDGLVPVPFVNELRAWSSGVEPITYTWTVNGQNIGSGPVVTHTFQGGMAHTILVTWVDANGCTGFSGDGDFGMPCDGIGPSGTSRFSPCDDGNPNTQLDTWNNDCECVGVTDISNAVTVRGTVNGCTQTGQQVGIYVPSVFGGSMFTGPDCTYEFMFIPGGTATQITVSTSCDGGATFQNTNVAWTPGMTEVVVDFTCPPDPPCTAEACFTIAQASGGGQLTPFTAEFTNCTSGGVSPYAYSWWLPDGTSSAQGNETFTFNSPGTYGVCLTVTDAAGCVNSLCDTLYVDADGNITTTPNNVDCLGIPGGIAVAGTPCTTFLGLPGTWSPTCVCETTVPCAACFEPEQALDGPSGLPIPFTAYFDASCTQGVPNYVAWFDYGDGTGDWALPTHTYASAGTYNVCLTITDAIGCTSTFCENVTVNADGSIGTVNTDPCEAEFFVMQAYQWVDSAANPNGGGGEPIPNELWVWNLSSGGTGFFQFTWSFGDGTSSTEAFPTHTYASGEYELCLTVTDNAGCTDAFCDTVSVDGDGILNGLMGVDGSRNAFTIHVMNPLAAGVIEKPAFTELATWPNPVENELNITLNSELRGTARVTVTDLSGRAVLSETRMVTNGQNRLLVPVADLSAGLYLVQIGNGASTVSSRFVKVR